jgi:hypothetical protein
MRAASRRLLTHLMNDDTCCLLLSTGLFASTSVVACTSLVPYTFPSARAITRRLSTSSLSLPPFSVSVFCFFRAPDEPATIPVAFLRSFFTTPAPSSRDWEQIHRVCQQS